jgi:hypothetical protein
MDDELCNSLAIMSLFCLMDKREGRNFNGWMRGKRRVGILCVCDVIKQDA